MKILEKKVHFVAEGTSIGCYDSKGRPIRYILLDGEPYIELDDSVDRLFNIKTAAAHNVEPNWYANNRIDSASRVSLAGVINGRFVSADNSHWRYAERRCTHRELASFYLAMYKAQKNTIKLLEAEND